MRRKTNRRPGLLLPIILLCIALAAVIALIVYKQYEYAVSTEYYQSLRVGLGFGGMRA